VVGANVIGFKNGHKVCVTAAHTAFENIICYWTYCIIKSAGLKLLLLFVKT